MDKTNFLQLFQTFNLNLKELEKVSNLTRKEIIDILTECQYFGLENNNRIPLERIKNWHDAAQYYFNNCGKISVNQVAIKFNISKNVLMQYLRKYYPNREIIKPINYNDKVFDSIDTEEKAYWLGFIFADGCIDTYDENHQHYRFELLLKIDDQDHIRKFATFVNFTGKIQEKQNGKNKACRITLYGKHFWETLNSYGCTPRKSLTLEFPDISIFKDKSLIRHFIRGYFDGDGSLGIYSSTSKGYTTHNKIQCNVLGTKKFLSGVNTNIPFPKSISSCDTIKSPNRAFRLQWATKEAFSLCFYLYHNSNIFLDRKYTKYLSFRLIYKELYNELSSKIGEGWDANPELIASITKGEATV